MEALGKPAHHTLANHWARVIDNGVYGREDKRGIRKSRIDE